jgi:hypothetical protein
MAMGKVYFPANEPWVNDLVSELLRFPAGKNDDQVDVLGLFGRMLDDLIAGDKPREETDILRQPTWNDLIVAHDKNRQSAGRPRRI